MPPPAHTRPGFARPGAPQPVHTSPKSSDPNKDQKHTMSSHFAPTARAGMNTSGLLAPNPRQGDALHPARTHLAKSNFAVSGSVYPAEAPYSAREQSRKGKKMFGIRCGRLRRSEHLRCRAARRVIRGPRCRRRFASERSTGAAC